MGRDVPGTVGEVLHAGSVTNKGPFGGRIREEYIMVLLNRPYGGFAAGAIAQFPATTEAALIAQGIATASSAAPTSGAITNNGTRGKAAVAIGASSVVVTCPACDANSIVLAVVSQAAADGTLLRVERVVPAAGSFTVYGTAAATAATVIAWAVFNGNNEPFN